MNNIVYVGMDVHKESYTLCCYCYDTDKVEYQQTIPADYKLVLKYMEQVRKRYIGEVSFVCGYEAGCLGYSLYNQLKAHEVDCKILAPSTMAITNTSHVKTDKRDAANIARCLAFHTYSEVYVPDAEDNDVKEYIRMRDAQKKMLKKIKQQILAFVLRLGKHFEEGKSPDLYLTDFVYNRADEGKTHCHNCHKTYPINKFVTWEDFKAPNNEDFFMMHMFTYKLEILKKSKLHLPEHTFYVDNLYVYQPLYYVKTMYYHPVGLYQYYVGHADQSINYENMAKNYKHAMRVYKCVFSAYTLDELNKLSKAHRKYMLFSIVVIEALTVFYSVLAPKQGSKKEYKALRKEYKATNRALYKKIQWGTRFIISNLLIPGIKDICIKIGYKIVKKKTGWY